MGNNCAKAKEFIIKIAVFKIKIAERYLAPLTNFFVRLYLGSAFLKSGLLKLQFWDDTIALFTYEFHVMFFSPFVAAVVSTSFEILFALMLFIGLGTRIAAFFMAVMVLVMEYSYQTSVIHHLWIMLLLMITFYGPGFISLDHLIRKIYWPRVR